MSTGESTTTYSTIAEANEGYRAEKEAEAAETEARLAREKQRRAEVHDKLAEKEKAKTAAYRREQEKRGSRLKSQQHDKCLSTWLANGGTEEAFEAQWDDMYTRILEDIVVKQHGKNRKPSTRIGATLT